MYIYTLYRPVLRSLHFLGRHRLQKPTTLARALTQLGRLLHWLQTKKGGYKRLRLRLRTLKWVLLSCNKS